MKLLNILITILKFSRDKKKFDNPRYKNFNNLVLNFFQNYDQF